MMPRKKTEVKLYTVETRLPDKLYERLVSQAAENDRSIAAELRIAVRTHLLRAAA